jgi:hypothetical protein
MTLYCFLEAPVFLKKHGAGKTAVANLVPGALSQQDRNVFDICILRLYLPYSVSEIIYIA